jgi:hypothetical protein
MICTGKIELRGRWPKQYWQDLGEQCPRAKALIESYMAAGWGVRGLSRSGKKYTFELWLVNGDGSGDRWMSIERNVLIHDIKKDGRYKTAFGIPKVTRFRDGQIKVFDRQSRSWKPTYAREQLERARA